MLIQLGHSLVQTLPLCSAGTELRSHSTGISGQKGLAGSSKPYAEAIGAGSCSGLCCWFFSPRWIQTRATLGSVPTYNRPFQNRLVMLFKYWKCFPKAHKMHFLWTNVWWNTRPMSMPDPDPAPRLPLFSQGDCWADSLCVTTYLWVFWVLALDSSQQHFVLTLSVGLGHVNLNLKHINESACLAMEHIPVLLVHFLRQEIWAEISPMCSAPNHNGLPGDRGGGLGRASGRHFTSKTKTRSQLHRMPPFKIPIELAIPFKNQAQIWVLLSPQTFSITSFIPNTSASIQNHTYY